jgi:glycosyltransferase involved in cell wall biosynthesis
MKTALIPVPFSPVASPEPAPKLSVVIPVRNEGVNLRIMIRILGAAIEVPYEVLVVHDDEKDDSIPVVEAMANQHAHLVHNRLGRGVANAIRAGVNQARGQYILIFAADEVGPVLAIEDMLRLMDQGCDLVSCTRYARGGRRLGGSRVGGVLSRAANAMFHALTGSVLTDSTTGIKMVRRTIFDRLDLRAAPVGWAVAFEMAIKAQLAGLQLGEVPIVSIDRLYGGESTFRLGPWVLEYLKWFWFGVRNAGDMRKNGRRLLT